MDIHERNNHLECNMNNEGTRSHYKCPTHPLCSPLTPTAPSPAGPIHYFALDYLWPLVRFQRKWNCSFPSARLLAREQPGRGLLQTWGPTGPILKLLLSVVKFEKKNNTFKRPAETPLAIGDCCRVEPSECLALRRYQLVPSVLTVLTLAAPLHGSAVPRCNLHHQCENCTASLASVQNAWLFSSGWKWFNAWKLFLHAEKWNTNLQSVLCIQQKSINVKLWNDLQFYSDQFIRMSFTS